jgi:flavin reductase (DIM6/NTAB) family NADH-FMN oxidoreductase RutF
MADAGIDPKSFRTALGRFASGVTLITTAGPDGIHGMTANAFTSVSLDPPLVLVAIAQQARTHSFLSATRRFGVSVLSVEQEEFAWHFAGRPREGLSAPFIWKRDVPLLQHALAHLVCRIEATYPGGDHSLFLSRVEELWYRDGSPLTYYQGRFFGLIPLPAGAWSAADELILNGGDEQTEPPPGQWW